MNAVVKDLISKAQDTRVKETLQKSAGRIAEHTATLKSLLTAAGGEIREEHCRAMEGLVREARMHIFEEAIGDGALKRSADPRSISAHVALRVGRIRHRRRVREGVGT